MCGIFGVHNHDNALLLALNGADYLVNRGQAGTGIAFISNRNRIHVKTELSSASYFSKNKFITKINGVTDSIAQDRYPTKGASNKENLQPMYREIGDFIIVLDHNGQIGNYEYLKETYGGTYNTTTDSEVPLVMMENSGQKKIENMLRYAMLHMDSSYSLLIMSVDSKSGTRKMIAAKDPLNVRPLWIGSIDESFVVSSEDSAITSIGGNIIRDVEPGEMVIFEKNQMTSRKVFESYLECKCMSEEFYLGNIKSVLFKVKGGILEDKILDEVRKMLGFENGLMDRELDIDMICGVPNTGISSTVGHTRGMNSINKNTSEYNQFIIKSPRMKDPNFRTFINPENGLDLAWMKYDMIGNEIRGKKVMAGEDTIIRGNTMPAVAAKMYIYGAEEIHLRAAAPPYFNTCDMGIAITKREELIAAPYFGLPHKDVEEAVRIQINILTKTRLLEEAEKYYGQPRKSAHDAEYIIFHDFPDIDAFRTHLEKTEPVKSVRYLSTEGLDLSSVGNYFRERVPGSISNVFGKDINGYCLHCLGGAHPPGIEESIKKGYVKVLPWKD